MKIQRLLLVAPPGNGKTWTLQRTIEKFRAGGVIVDPLGELRPFVGVRWSLFDAPRLSAMDEKEQGELFDAIERLPAGAALIVDEAARYIPNVPYPERNRLFRILDVARNRGVRFALAEKRPQRLPPLVSDLVDTFAFRPFRSASARDWLRAAGADVDELQPIPLGEWYLLEPGGGVQLVGANELTGAFGNSLTSRRERL